LSFFLVPSNFLASTAVIGLLLMVLRFRLGAIVAALSLAAIAVAALSPLGNALLTPLDQRFPAAVYPAGLHGIIVLGGSYDRTRHSDLSTIVLEDDTEPLALLAHLGHRYPEAKIVFSGNGTDTLTPEVSESDFVKPYLESFGIASERIVVEDKSRTTAESAQLAAQLLHPTSSSQWLLVTFGHRMPRAMGAFRKAGFNVSAFPAGLRTKAWSDMWSPEKTAANNLRHLDIAVHEWLALVYYKLKGYSDDWFAGPLASDECGKACLDAQNTQR
jgi:uncharacterized SAM-binding protein YcdF (DUF218 family)